MLFLIEIFNHESNCVGLQCSNVLGIFSEMANSIIACNVLKWSKFQSCGMSVF